MEKRPGGGTNWIGVPAHADKTWLPGTPIVLRRELALPAQLPPAEYQLGLGLFERTSGAERPVGSR